MEIELTASELEELKKEAISDFLTSITDIYCGRNIPTYFNPLSGTSSTDGSEISISEFPVEIDNEEDYYRIILDTLAHECEHINNGNTDEQMEEFLNEHNSSTWAKLMLNLVEDSRIDYTRGLKYPGMRINEKFVGDIAFDKLRTELDKDMSKTDRIVEGVLQINAKGIIKGYAEDDEIAFFKKVKGILRHVRTVDDFKTRRSFAQYLVNEGIKLGINPPKVMKLNMSGGKVMLTSDGDGNGVPIGNLPKSLEDKLKDIEGDISSNASSTSSNDGTSKGLAKAMKKAIQNHIMDHDAKEIISRLRGKSKPKRKNNSINAQQVISELDSLLRKIKTATSRSIAKRGRKINVRKYIRFKCGSSDQRLYWDEHKSRPGDRAICLAVDCSGSMSGMMKDVVKAGYAISYVAEQLGDNVSVIGYREIGSGVKNIENIKMWEEPVDKDYFEKIPCGGNTPTPFALKTSMHLLDEASKSNKLLIVLEDGFANVSMADMNGENYLGLSSDAETQAKQMVGIIRERGIKVLGIYIGRNDNGTKNRMENLYGRGNCIIISDTKYLGRELFRFYKKEMGLRF